MFRGFFVTAAVTAALAGAAQAQSVTIVAAGDIVFGRHHDGVLKPFKDDLFAPVADTLKSADIAFANLETPIAEGPAVLPGGGKGGVIRRGIGWMRFRGEPARARQLAEAGFDVVSTANNHAYDAGTPAITETHKHLTAAGVSGVGSGETPEALVVVSRNGLKIGFLGATLVSNRENPDPRLLAFVEPADAPKVLVPRVAAARAKVDFLIVSLHWGSEYSQAASAQQRKLAHALVDAGADAVLGHHPHVLQGLERYQGKVIAYSLGNFVFDMAADVKRESMMLRLGLTAGRITATVIPVLIDADHVPSPAKGERAVTIANKLKKLSNPWATVLRDATDGSLEID